MAQHPNAVDAQPTRPRGASATDEAVAVAFSFEMSPEVVQAIADLTMSRVVAVMGDRPDYMSTGEVAAYLGWSKKRIDNLCGQVRIPFRKDGGRRIFVRQEIDEWVTQLDGTSVSAALASC